MQGWHGPEGEVSRFFIKGADPGASRKGLGREFPARLTHTQIVYMTILYACVALPVKLYERLDVDIHTHIYIYIYYINYKHKQYTNKHKQYTAKILFMFRGFSAHFKNMWNSHSLHGCFRMPIMSNLVEVLAIASSRVGAT